MKKITIVAAITCGVLFVGLVIARLTNTLQFYRIPVSSMSPTLNPGSNIITSNLVEAKIGDIIVFNRISDEFDGVQEPGQKLTFTYRLVANGGNKLQIKDGLVYVNGKYADDSTHLKFFYSFSAKKNDAIIEVMGKKEEDINEYDWFSNTIDSTTAALSYTQYIKAKAITPLRKFVSPFGGVDTSLYKNNYSKKWTANNYGPISIPSNTCFLLGDNRNAARDSRYIGPIPMEDIKGVMIGKY